MSRFDQVIKPLVLTHGIALALAAVPNLTALRERNYAVVILWHEPDGTRRTEPMYYLVTCFSKSCP